MLAHHQRLKRSQDFQAARQYGKYWRGRLLSITVRANSLPYARFGFIVTRRVGNAVTRNRVKRRLRAAIRTLLPELSGGYDTVVIAQPEAVQAPFQALVSALRGLFVKAGMLGRPDAQMQPGR